MTAEAAYRLSVRLTTDYYNGGHVTYFIPDMNDVAAVATWISALADDAESSAAQAAASYVAMVALGASAYSIGTLGLSLPRVGQLGVGAFADLLAFVGRYPNTQDATYQITPHDFGKILLCTSGTRTWTLPLAADLPDGWWCSFRNRSGNNLTINRSGTDTFNAAATTIAVATGNEHHIIVKTSSTTFEVSG